MANNSTIGDLKPLIIEQTSSSENHYELVAIVDAIRCGFGLDQEKPYLSQMKDDLHVIRVLMEEGYELSEQMRLEAQKILDAHAKSVQEYLHEIEEPVPVDYYPFSSMATGTTVRDLPDGGRIFGLTDGALLRVFADGKMSAIDENGIATQLGVASGGKVTLPDGRKLSLVQDAIKTTHEAAGISGLPDGVEPVLASSERYTVTLPDGTRLEVYQSSKIAAVINPSGTIDVLGISRIEGIGESVETHTISAGAKSFKCIESGHAGIIEAGGTIHLALADGIDLIIHFPDDSGSGGEDDNDHGAVCFNCQEPQ